MATYTITVKPGATNVWGDREYTTITGAITAYKSNVGTNLLTNPLVINCEAFTGGLDDNIDMFGLTGGNNATEKNLTIQVVSGHEYDFDTGLGFYLKPTSSINHNSGSPLFTSQEVVNWISPVDDIQFEHIHVDMSSMAIDLTMSVWGGVIDYDANWVNCGVWTGQSSSPARFDGGWRPLGWERSAMINCFALGGNYGLEGSGNWGRNIRMYNCSFHGVTRGIQITSSTYCDAYATYANRWSVPAPDASRQFRSCASPRTDSQKAPNSVGYPAYNGTAPVFETNTLRPTLSDTVLLENGYVTTASANPDINGDSRPKGVAWDIGPFETTLIVYYDVTVTTSTHGSATLEGVNSVEEHTDFTTVITPDAGYAIYEILVDGSPIAITDTVVLEDVTANHTIAITFCVRSLRNKYKQTIRTQLFIDGAAEEVAILPRDTTILGTGTHTPVTTSQILNEYLVATEVVD